MSVRRVDIPVKQRKRPRTQTPAPASLLIQKVVVINTQSRFHNFKTAVESHWHKAVPGSGVTLQVNVELTRDLWRRR